MPIRYDTKTDEYDDSYDAFDDYYIDHRNRQQRISKPKRASTNLLPGIVVRALGHHFEVQITQENKSGTKKSAKKRIRLCEVRGRLRQQKTFDTLVAVGDRVWVRPDGAKRGLIEQVDERESVLSRQRPGATTLAEDVIIANPDQVVIVFSVAQPEPHLRMLDRFLVIAEYNELPAYICVNKIDLVGLEKAREIFKVYEEIGCEMIYASSVTGEGVEKLQALLTDSLTVLTGPSGVGKSSLINEIQPELNLKVGGLREFLEKGKHTTRNPQLFLLPFGQNTYIADTPGIRELGLFVVEA